MLFKRWRTSKYTDERRMPFILRGTVESHSTETVGMGIFRHEIFALMFRMDEEQTWYLNRTISEPPYVSEAYECVATTTRIPFLLRYPCTQEVMDEFPVGTLIGVSVLLALTTTDPQPRSIFDSEIPFIKVGELFLQPDANGLFPSEYLPSEDHRYRCLIEDWLSKIPVRENTCRRYYSDW